MLIENSPPWLRRIFDFRGGGCSGWIVRYNFQLNVESQSWKHKIVEIRFNVHVSRCWLLVFNNKFDINSNFFEKNNVLKICNWLVFHLEVFYQNFPNSFFLFNWLFVLPPKIPSTRFSPSDGTPFNWQIELNTKKSTKRPLRHRLVECLVFNSAFGRQSNKLIMYTLSSVGDCHVEIFMVWSVHRRQSPMKNSLWYEDFNMTITNWW